MVDMTTTIAPKSDQLNADDLIDRIITIRVTRVSASGEPEQPVSLNFDGDNGKPYKPCKSMRRAMVHVWGKDGASYVGKSMTLYRDPRVKFGALAVGGIRISHMSGIEKSVTMALTATKGQKVAYTVLPLVEDAPRPTKTVHEWVADLKADLATAPNRDAADVIAGREDVRSAVNDTARPKLQAAVNQIVKDALDRFAVVDDGDFPGDMTTTQDAA